ncbi:unnamed protein product [Spirodela intermedia]|uniref:BHLH domain-containing protein n=1 Tax=Spirodela intermedia TaxID=51605 RepID=A0A7I8JCR3_SPIIN|nr:unnamed protein product [Spirodela intermedia]CAA6667889.1 unnamed protein product [Spirodela intermedia]
MERSPSLAVQLAAVDLSNDSQFDQMDCLLVGDFAEFGEEDLCSSVVEQVLGFYSDGGPGLVEADAEEDDSSGTTGERLRPGRDRARTLVSERRRRGRMKEKLYELRSLVPNITKMDKASIIGDAIMYEIARLESLAEAAYCSHLHHREPETLGAMDPLPKRVMLEFSGCGLGTRGMPAAVYRALEKLTFLHLESSSLSTCSEKHEVTPTMKVDGSAGEIHSSVLKSWVMTVLMDEGFGFHVEARS